MRYKSLVLIIIFFAIIISAMELDKGFEARVLNVGDRIKMFFITTAQGTQSAYERYFNQAQQIKDLQEKLTNYEVLKAQNLILQNENNQLLDILEDVSNQVTATNLNGEKSVLRPEFRLAYINAFVHMQDTSRVWLYLEKSTLSNLYKDQIMGIMRDGSAIGIAKVENGRVKGYLNGALECSYSVRVGEALGMIDGDLGKNGELTAGYIPKWADVKKGDEVVASGLDGIFLSGTPVGVVAEVIDEPNAIKVVIKPNSNAQDIGYAWLIDTKAQMRSANILSVGEDDEESN